MRFLRAELPDILATQTDVLSPRMSRVIEELAGDWRRLDARIEGLTGENETLAHQDQHCERLMTVPGVGPIISSAWWRRSAPATCSYLNIVNPVMLPPGRARLATKPAPTGTMATKKTIGTVWVACSNGATVAVPA